MPGTSKFVYYTPYQSSRTEELLPTGEIIKKTTKTNATGCLVNHLEYMQKKLRKQELTESENNSVLPADNVIRERTGKFTFVKDENYFID